VVSGSVQSLQQFVASWFTHWEPFFVINRALSAACGTATVAALFWMGRHLWNDMVGIVAAFLLSLAYLHVRESHFGTTDVAMAFFAVMAVACLIDAHRHRRSLTVAAVLAGLSAATKYGGVLLAAPLALSQAFYVFSAPNRSRAFFDRRLRDAAVGFGLAFLVGVPFVIFDLDRFLVSMSALSQSMQAGVGGPPTQSGWWYHLSVSLRYGIGLPMLAAALAGLIGILIDTLAIGVLLAAFPLLFYVVSATSRNLFFRYMIPLVPFLCLTAAWLVERAATRLAAWAPESRQSSTRVGLATMMAVAIVSPSAMSVWQFDRTLSQTDNRVIVARWFAEHVPKGSSVLQSGSFAGHAQLARELNYTHWIWNGRNAVFKVGKELAQGRPDFILLQESPLPSATQVAVTEFLKHDYVVVERFVAAPIDSRHVYGRQDAFFVSYAGFDEVKRPGPNFTLYKHVDAPMH
jgi:uncharacterized membrane protein